MEMSFSVYQSINFPIHLIPNINCILRFVASCYATCIRNRIVTYWFKSYPPCRISPFTATWVWPEYVQQSSYIYLTASASFHRIHPSGPRIRYIYTLLDVGFIIFLFPVNCNRYTILYFCSFVET
jgi:hypothetical protein